MNIHLDEIDLLLLWHDLIHIRLEAGVGLNGLCANSALGRRLDLAFGSGCQTDPKSISVSGSDMPDLLTLS